MIVLLLATVCRRPRCTHSVRHVGAGNQAQVNSCPWSFCSREGLAQPKEIRVVLNIQILYFITPTQAFSTRHHAQLSRQRVLFITSNVFDLRA